jgi:hypothetical protein
MNTHACSRLLGASWPISRSVDAMLVMHAGMIVLQLLTTQPEHAAVKAIKGFVISATPVRVPMKLLPPKPVVWTLLALGTAFPKCGFFC